jgi:hypothetical protein
MNRPELSATPLLLGLLLLAPLQLAAGEITVLGGQAAGDYGTDSDIERQSATVRYVLGDKNQLRAELDVLRLTTEFGVVATPLGPVPGPGRGGRQGTLGGSGQGAGAGGTTDPEIDAATAESVLAEETTSGLGDLRLTFSRRFLGGGAKVYRLDGEVGVKAPTADEQDFLGTGEWDYRVGVAGEYRSWSLTTFGGLGWNSLGDPEWVELSNALDAFVGVESQPLGDRVILSGWLEGNEEVVPGTGSRTALGIGLVGSRKLRWRAQLIAGLGGSAEDFSATFGVSFGVSSPTVGSRRMG